MNDIQAIDIYTIDLIRDELLRFRGSKLEAMGKSLDLFIKAQAKEICTFPAYRFGRLLTSEQLKLEQAFAEGWNSAIKQSLSYLPEPPK